MWRMLENLAPLSSQEWGQHYSRNRKQNVDAAVLGLLQLHTGVDNLPAGRVVVFGDSACLESTHDHWPTHRFCEDLVHLYIACLSFFIIFCVTIVPIL